MYKQSGSFNLPRLVLQFARTSYEACMKNVLLSHVTDEGAL
jgi:hypothetical protein